MAPIRVLLTLAKVLALKEPEIVNEHLMPIAVSSSSNSMLLHVALMFCSLVDRLLADAEETTEANRDVARAHRMSRADVRTIRTSRSIDCESRQSVGRRRATPFPRS